MKHIKFLMNGAAAVALAFCAVSCGDSENEEPQSPGLKPDWTDSEKGDVREITTDEQAKEYLGETAALVMDKFKPADQKPLVELAVAFANDYEDYTVDLSGAKKSAASPRASRSLGRFFAQTRKAAATGHYASLGPAAMNVLELGLFSGVYEPDAERRVFTRTADSDDVVVRFFHNGTRCELKVTPSADTWTFDAHQATEGDIDAVYVPRTITFSLTEGSKTLVGGTLKSYFAEDREMLLATDVTALNIRAASDFSATNSLITTSDALYIDGTGIVATSGKINGKNMVNGAALEQIMDVETDSWQEWTGNGYVTRYYTYYEVNPAKAADMFRGAEASAKLLGRVNLVAQAPDSKKFLAIGDSYFDEEDYSSPSQARNACQEACDHLNAAVPAKLFLAGSSSATVSLKWQPRRVTEDYGWGSYAWWEAEPVLAFADGSTYSVADYGVADFTGAVAQFESLAKAYENMFNALF